MVNLLFAVKIKLVEFFVWSIHGAHSITNDNFSFFHSNRWLMNPQIFEVILDKLNEGGAIVIDNPMVSSRNRNV